MDEESTFIRDITENSHRLRGICTDRGKMASERRTDYEDRGDEVLI